MSLGKRQCAGLGFICSKNTQLPSSPGSRGVCSDPLAGDVSNFFLSLKYCIDFADYKLETVVRK